MDERWLPVVAPGYEETHQVSNLGRVKSNERYVPHYSALSGYALRKERILHPYRRTIPDHGCISRVYKIYIMNATAGRTSFDVPRLVYEAFVGPIPPGHLTFFIDGNWQNVTPDNIGLTKETEMMRMWREHPDLIGTAMKDAFLARLAGPSGRG